MSELPFPPANSNLNSIEDYLKNKYQFLSEKSPYSQQEFLQKTNEKPLISKEISPEMNLSPIEISKKNHEDTMNITIFRDLQLNGNDRDLLLRKYENLSKESNENKEMKEISPFLAAKSQHQPLIKQNFQINSQTQSNSRLTSDPKLNKLLSDVENIVQKATGKALNLDNESENKPLILSQNKLNYKKNADIENHEIRAYLKNLDSKLNIIVPKREQKENFSQKKQGFERKPKETPKHERSFSSKDSEKSEKSPSFEPPYKQEPKNAAFNNRNSVVARENSAKDRKYGKSNPSPGKNSAMKSSRSNSRHIFEKIAPDCGKFKDFGELDECFSRKNQFKKSAVELENNVFCVNCEEFVNENKIDEHSKVCHKITTSHRVPSCENKYNSNEISRNNSNIFEGFREKSANVTTTIGEIKQINEQLNKLNAVLSQRIKCLENSSFFAYEDPLISQQVIFMLSRFFELTINLIHNKDVNTISQISRNLYEIFVNLQEINQIPVDILQTLQKIKQNCKAKYEILDPGKNYFETLTSAKGNCGNSLANFQRISTINNVSNCYISDTLSQITGFSRISKVFDNKKPPSEGSLGSDTMNSKALKKKFFNLAIKMKLCLQKGHPGHQINLSDLFLECLQLRLAENEWQEFLEAKLGIYC